MKNFINYSIVSVFAIFALVCSILSIDQIWPITIWSIFTVIFSLVGGAALGGGFLVLIGWIKDNKEPDSWMNVK